MHGPTHNRRHTLDLLISRGLNISSIVIKDVALSDHFCSFFDILIFATTESRSVSVRNDAFPLCGMTRLGTARYGTARLGSGRFALQTQSSAALLFTCHYSCAASTAVTSS